MPILENLKGFINDHSFHKRFINFIDFSQRTSFHWCQLFSVYLFVCLFLLYFFSDLYFFLLNLGSIYSSFFQLFTKIARKYYEQLYDHKFNNLDKMHNFLKDTNCHNLVKKNNLNISKSIQKLNLCFKTSPQRKF